MPSGVRELLQSFRISPDGRSLACPVFDAVGGTPDLWLIDTTRGTKTRFTFGPSNDANPVWSPDASRIAYSSNQEGHFEIFVKRVVGSDKETRAVATDHDVFLQAWTPDGRYLLAHELGANGQGQLRAFPVDGTGPDPLAGGNLPRSLGGVMGLYRISLSPDGKWLAFESAEGGRDEIYAIPFGSTGRRWQITLSGGTNPHWAGHHVYFEKDREIWRVSVTPSDAGLAIGDEQRVYAGQWADDFDVTRDETRMVVLRGTRGEDTTPLSLITNWHKLLDSRAR